MPDSLMMLSLRSVSVLLSSLLGGHPCKIDAVTTSANTSGVKVSVDDLSALLIRMLSTATIALSLPTVVYTPSG